MKQFIYTDKDVIMIVRAENFARAIKFVEARYYEETQKLYFADERNMIEYENGYEGVLYSVCDVQIENTSVKAHIKIVRANVVETPKEIFFPSSMQSDKMDRVERRAERRAFTSN